MPLPLLQRMFVWIFEVWNYGWSIQDNLSRCQMSKGNLLKGIDNCQYGNMGCGVFKWGDTKLERFLPKNQHTQRKLLNFEFWINGELSKSAKIWLSKSIFYVKTHLELSQFFFPLWQCRSQRDLHWHCKGCGI